jgi:predicted RNase H-like nuclease (RuvC/YqgF family)
MYIAYSKPTLMAASRLHIEAELYMEERVARLEANVEHIKSDVSEMKTDIRRLDQKIDGVKDSVNGLRVETREMFGILDSKIASVDSKIDRSVAGLELKLEKGFAALKIGMMVEKVWWLVIAAALLSVMARGFKWI